jgi:hypothetical protein
VNTAPRIKVLASVESVRPMFTVPQRELASILGPRLCPHYVCHGNSAAGWPGVLLWGPCSRIECVERAPFPFLYTEPE